MTRVAGADIARGAWLVVYLDEGGCFDDAVVVERLSDTDIDAEVVAIDVPLDLPGDSIGRAAEFEARRRLGPRRSSVFSSLPAELYAADYTEEARQDAHTRYGSAYSKQAWNLRTAIWDAADARSEAWYETHPELAFGEIAGGPLDSKKRWAGVRQRIDCLASVGIDLPAVSGDLHPDDALDAAVCAHVAWRIAMGVASRVPETGPGPYIWF